MNNIGWKQYLDTCGIKWGKEWQEYLIENPSGVQESRSMLTLFELALLYALAKDHYTGEGAIIDGGPLLGLTTNSLAKGLYANRGITNKRKRIYTFDLFQRSCMGVTVDRVPDITGSVFDAFLQLNRDYLDSIYISPGDLLAHHWNGGPIEILFVDVAKSWELNDFVIDQFFTQLIPNRSYLVHQDYVYFHPHWIHTTMAAFGDAFELVDVVMGASAVFRCKRKIEGGKFATSAHFPSRINCGSLTSPPVGYRHPRWKS